MTAAEFLAALDTLGLTREAFAARFGLHRSAVYRWGRERAVPPWVPPVLEMMRQGESLDALLPWEPPHDQRGSL